VAFPGTWVGTGIDGEPLAIPHGQPLLRLSWTTLLRRLSVTDAPPTIWSPASAARWDTASVSRPRRGNRHFVIHDVHASHRMAAPRRRPPSRRGPQERTAP
jgi:hypothetical protein